MMHDEICSPTRESEFTARLGEARRLLEIAETLSATSGDVERRLLGEIPDDSNPGQDPKPVAQNFNCQLRDILYDIRTRVDKALSSVNRLEDELGAIGSANVTNEQILYTSSGNLKIATSADVQTNIARDGSQGRPPHKGTRS